MSANDSDRASAEQMSDADTASAPIPAPVPAGQTMGFAFAAAGALLFSTKAIAIKLAYRESIDAETLLALRMILALPFYGAIGLHSLRDRRLKGRGLPSARLVALTLGVGLLGYWVSSYLDFLGLEYISAQIERLILFTYPLFVVIFGTLFFGQRISRRALVAVGISYAGLVVIFGQNAITGGKAGIVGGVFVLAAAIVFAFYQLFAKSLIGIIGPRLFTCIAMSGAAAGALVQFFLTHPPADLLVSGRVWLISIYLAIGATVLPSFFNNAALHRISAQANATIGNLSPVATIILAWLVLSEMLTPLAWLGTALVLAGVGWFTVAERKP
jgi:drug/metabolite transporter (DMT)-like permease